ncbi:BCCT family transporter [Alkalilimnicola sp. S0819]|uniref:BCCT family transporter n=1 Tax=Alkalilimnicola sp. S0819 TaxID=2613922 RepID=UPI00126140AB|nr:choline BCCT transporter BetT [Alkalilimnicola sp. S0819]KAB7628278.1 BCCT family transporter [Alkalilimnicola sp. S0819]MPQ15174.1 BCCT family transporter [Alkalilimnicola sp. S0819]
MSKQQSGPRAVQINPPVFFASAGLILFIVVFAAAAPSVAETVFTGVQGWIVDTFGWFYMLAVAVFLVFSLGLAFSGFGAVKLGPDHSEPEFSYRSWFAMLFSAGMGIGLLFFGVAEPVLHFASPPVGEGGDVQAARNAMSITMFHWGLHAWSIYAVVGLALAYFSFRHGLPLTIRSALYPLIGERIHGPIGHTVDTFAVLGTMFGVATSLGLGVMQVNAGLAYLLGVPENTLVQIVLIALITLFATGSVVAGLDAGIRRLSELNLVLAAVLLLFVLFTGPTLYLLGTLVQNTGNYFSQIVHRTFNLRAYAPSDWMGAWTLFYWGWWIAWSPFVGMFIARVSRGRTIRQFVFGVLFVPFGFTLMWMTFFGNTALNIELNDATAGLSALVAENIPVALFQFFERLPLSTLASGLATVLVVTFFVTSSDSGSLVIDIITSGGSEEPPVWQRIFWALFEGVVAAVLLLAGGLQALQTGAIASALPFVFVMLLICYGLYQGLSRERLKKVAFAIPPAPSLPAGRVTWQKRLKNIASHADRPSVAAFIQDTARPALVAVAQELAAQNLEAHTELEDDRVRLRVNLGDDADFLYCVVLRGYEAPGFAFPEFRLPRDRKHTYFRAEVYLAEGSQHYDVMGYTEEQLIGDVLGQYERHMHYLHLALS